MKQNAKPKHKGTCFSLSDSGAGRKFQFIMKIFTIDLLSTRQPATLIQVDLAILAKLSLIVKHVARQKPFSQTNRIFSFTLSPKEFR